MTNSSAKSDRTHTRQRRASTTVAGLFVATGAAVILAAAAQMESMQQQAPTFARDIAPIFYANCTSCHRPGGLGPMSLLTYADAKAKTADIRLKVSRGVMPPWHSDAPRGLFNNDRRLSDSDKSAILRWLDAGAPQGNPADQPAPPQYSDSWSIGTPDVVLAMPNEFEVPAQGEIAYQYFQVPTGFTEDKWVQAIEVLPGAREVVHHVLVYASVPRSAGDAASGAAAGRGAAAAGGGSGAGAAGAGAAGAGAGRGAGAAAAAAGRGASAGALQARVLGTLIATTAPGTNAQVFPLGTALRIASGTVLTLQMHYTTHGTPHKDRSSVGIVFAKAPPVTELRASQFVNTRLVIPAGASDHRVDAEIAFSRATKIYGMMPHTHLRGARWEYRLVKPDGTSETIFNVPTYDFNWQTYYMFTEPLNLPAGSRIVSSAWYDNSTANKSNPDPTAEVRWGDQTWEEMQYTGFLYTQSDPPPGER
jgi:hypothetical protein